MRCPRRIQRRCPPGNVALRSDSSGESYTVASQVPPYSMSPPKGIDRPTLACCFKHVLAGGLAVIKRPSTDRCRSHHTQNDTPSLGKKEAGQSLRFTDTPSQREGPICLRTRDRGHKPPLRQRSMALLARPFPQRLARLAPISLRASSYPFERSFGWPSWVISHLSVCFLSSAAIVRETRHKDCPNLRWSGPRDTNNLVSAAWQAATALVGWQILSPAAGC
jgi:hypothetical protein